MILIGITGAARSGKDTAADYLCEQIGFKKYSFATPIKAAVKTMFGLTEDHVNGHLKEVVLPDLGVSPRFLMQTLGTEWGRKIVNDQVWLLAAQRQIENCYHGGHGRIVIPDIRFENEASFIREKGGLLIHVNRPDCEKVLAHESENGVSVMPYDAQIINNGTLKQLYNQVELSVSRRWRL
jgi:hypothetical protein